MLTIDPSLRFSLAAGEPFVLEVQFRDGNGAIVDRSDRHYSLAFYTPPRLVSGRIEGEAVVDADGHRFRFVQDGSLSEALYGKQTGAVELAERLRNGRDVVFRGSFLIDSSASGLASSDNQVIARRGVRLTLRQAGGGLEVTTAGFEYAEGTEPAPSPTPTPSPSPSITEASVLFVAGQSQGMTPNASRATRSSAIVALPAAQAGEPGVRIWVPSEQRLAGYVAGSNSCPYSYAASADQPYGPEADFARLWLADNPGKQLVIVKLSIGSTPLQKGATFQNGTGGAANASIIECWDPTLPTSTGNANHALDNINAAALLKGYAEGAITALAAEGKAVRRLGMLWLQGQNDAYFENTASTYGTALHAFAAWARTNILDGGTAPFIITKVEDHVAAWPYQAAVRAAQVAEARDNLTSFLIETDDLALGDDGFHYAPSSLPTLAARVRAASTATHDPLPSPAPAPAPSPSPTPTPTPEPAPTPTPSPTPTPAPARPSMPVDLAMTNAVYGTGRFGQALSGGYGVGPQLPNTFTISGWVRAAPSNDVRVAFGQVSWGFVACQANGTVFAQVGGSGTPFNPPVVIRDGQWHHVALYAGEDGSKVAVDGIIVATDDKPFSQTGATTDSTFEVRTFAVDRVTYGWVGDVDEVAVWDIEQLAMPDAAYSGGEAELRHLWHLDGSGLSA